MPTEPYAFGYDTRPGKLGSDSGARLVNAFVEEAPPGSQAPLFIYCRPGLAEFSSLPTTGGYRGGIALDDRAYVVVGQVVYRISAGGTPTDIGSFPGTAPASMARNRRTNPHIAICSLGQRYLIETGDAMDSVATIADSHLGAANFVIFHAGYLVWTRPDGIFQVSELDDGATYAELDFASAEADPDGLVAAAARGSEIVLFGSKTTQFFTNVPDAFGFPYQPVMGATIPLGCLAPHSVATVNGVVTFAASDGTVRLLEGYSPTRISTHAIEEQIDRLTPTEKAGLRAWSFSRSGHSFYVLTSAHWTYACDLLTQLWFQWQSYGRGNWAPIGIVEFAGKRIVGHIDEPALFSLSADHHDDAGDALIWKIASAPFGLFPNRTIVDELYVGMAAGVGLLSGPDAVVDPQVMLRVSDDDGFSWSDEMTASLGRIGERSQETSFTGLGASQERGMRFELACSAAVSRALLSAAIRFTPLRP